MATYAELISQAQALMEQAENKRKQELASVISEIKSKMTEFGITLEDLGAKGGVRMRGKAKSPVEAKYKGPEGQLWTGRGRRPEWVNQALATGKSIEEFAI